MFLAKHWFRFPQNKFTMALEILYITNYQDPMTHTYTATKDITNIFPIWSFFLDTTNCNIALTADEILIQVSRVPGFPFLTARRFFNEWRLLLDDDLLTASGRLPACCLWQTMLIVFVRPSSGNNIFLPLLRWTAVGRVHLSSCSLSGVAPFWTWTNSRAVSARRRKLEILHAPTDESATNCGAAATTLLFKLNSIIRETVVTFERPMQFRSSFLCSGFYGTAILFSVTVLL